MTASILNRFNILVIMLLVSSLSFAQKDSKANPVVLPHKVVELTTEKLMDIVRANQKGSEGAPKDEAMRLKGYFNDVEALLTPVVEFNYIVRKVMGPYWEKASKNQREAFVLTFRAGFVETFAKGMAKFNDLKVEVQAPTKPVPESGVTRVVQKVVMADKSTTNIAYAMGRRKGSDKWMLINVVLDGVNLTNTFKSQFAQAVKEHKGDLDKAISGWSS